MAKENSLKKALRRAMEDSPSSAPAKASGGGRKAGLNPLLIMAIGSVALCWLYGIPGMVLGYLSLKRVWELRHSARGFRGTGRSKFVLARFASVSGAVLSAFFFVYYLLSVIYGAHFRFS